MTAMLFRSLVLQVKCSNVEKLEWGPYWPW